MTVPVLRPLITYDKEETITLARMIGTFDAHPGDIAGQCQTCRPLTAAVLATVKESEQKMDIEEIVRKTLSDLRFMTALNCEIIKDS